MQQRFDAKRLESDRVASKPLVDARSKSAAVAVLDRQKGSNRLELVDDWDLITLPLLLATLF
eukprot:1192036-Pleurochrysis_carterae.AAC.1